MGGRFQEIQEANLTTVEKAIRSLEVAAASNLELNDLLRTATFSSPQSEIVFFKVIKPYFLSRLIFFKSVYEIELRRPVGSREIQHAYLTGEQAFINHLFKKHVDFYQYTRSGRTHLDAQYFVRREQRTGDPSAGYLMDVDSTLSTGYDQLLATAIANEMLAEYLEATIEELYERQPKERRPKKLEWQAPKTALVELGYALKKVRAFGNATLDQIFECFQESFSVKLDNPSRTNQQIKFRKSGVASFLQELTKTQIEETDV